MPATRNSTAIDAWTQGKQETRAFWRPSIRLPRRLSGLIGLQLSANWFHERIRARGAGQLQRFLSSACRLRKTTCFRVCSGQSCKDQWDSGPV